VIGRFTQCHVCVWGRVCLLKREIYTNYATLKQVYLWCMSLFVSISLYTSIQTGGFKI